MLPLKHPEQYDNFNPKSTRMNFNHQDHDSYQLVPTRRVCTEVCQVQMCNVYAHLCLHICMHRFYLPFSNDVRRLIAF